MLANFTTTSDDEITNLYYVGRGRTVKTFLYQKGCTSKTPIAMQINTTTTEQQYNSTFDILTVSHSIDKSLIANNTQIWNSTSNNLEVCQVVELREEGIGEEDMVIITNEHELLINFNLAVDYNTGNITLVQADTLEESTNTNVNDYISAFKCDGEQFAASTTPHLENTELNICIESESTDVVIDKVKTMVSFFLCLDGWYLVECCASFQSSLRVTQPHYVLAYFIRSLPRSLMELTLLMELALTRPGPSLTKMTLSSSL